MEWQIDKTPILDIYSQISRESKNEINVSLQYFMFSFVQIPLFIKMSMSIIRLIFF